MYEKKHCQKSIKLFPKISIITAHWKQMFYVKENISTDCSFHYKTFEAGTPHTETRTNDSAGT